MDERPEERRLSRRSFATLAAAGTVSSLAVAQQVPQNTGVANVPATPLREGTQAEAPPFGASLTFECQDVKAKVKPFALGQVRLTAGPMHDAQEWNRDYLHRLSADRLLHNFRVTAGLPSTAQPLGGWEKPDCELRGHFAGHFLSACALMHASTGDPELKAKGDLMVAELAKCQAKLAGGYLSAFPTELFDRVKVRKKVWAPYYTLHKIMAGLLDMHLHCGNQQALDVVAGIAGWVDTWSAPIPEEQMQNILGEEYGGMNEVLYNLTAVTGDERWAKAGDRFTKKRFFNPLALRRDELRGLHVNTHVPQVIGAARRYELTGDVRFHDVADFFWYEVTGARCYATGGTSNGEGWLTQPRHLAEELKQDVATAECCCVYNMLKLTRQLYQWSGDPRYFDYYERVLLNHRLGTIRPKTGATMYYLSHTPRAWKTFGTEDDSFWCCTGTGVEEYSKLGDSIYFRDDDGLYVNLFVPSELNWREKNLSLRQKTTFPEESGTTLSISVAKPTQLTLRLRMPAWLASDASLKLNGKALDISAGPGSYLAVSRVWQNGDRVELALPMSLRAEAMPDDRTLQAFCYGPLVLAGDMGDEGLTPAKIVGPEGPEMEKTPFAPPEVKPAGADLASWIKPDGAKPLAFRIAGQPGDFHLAPLNSVFDKRYSIYWRVAQSASVEALAGV
jgi:uncharacterized protein